MGYKIGIDVGGTFTDFVTVGRDGEVFVTKVPSTPANQAQGVMEGLGRIARQQGLSPEELLGETDLIVHGTTVATNALLELKGARTGLITTRGFRDILEFRRGYKEEVFNPRAPAPPPILPRRRRLTVTERVNYAGEVLTPLDEAEAVGAIRRLKAAGVDSIAVCFLFSFLHPAHERRVGEIIEREHPQAAVSLSHEILPEVREFERLSTTAVNAYTSPGLMRYLERLQRELTAGGFRGQLLVMQSNGGTLGIDRVGRNAARTLLSGPSGGVMAGLALGELSGCQDFITADMGGTSYDVCLVRDNRPQVTTDHWFNRYRVALPMLDIHTIGAGGGSIAWVDPGGALHVGPQSAGADPGPACYGRGGREPTVTDANLILGYLDPDSFLGGEMRLDRQGAWEAIAEKVARPMGMEVPQAASGIFRIVNHNMANAIRVVSVQRGHDPRDFALVAFGGNGAVHAGVQARELGIRRVIVPRAATAFSALGLLYANAVAARMRAYLASSQALDLDRIDALYREMAAEAVAELAPLGLPPEKILLERSLDCRYPGQAHDLTVPLDSRPGRVTRADLEAAIARFHQLHERIHTFSNPDQPVQVTLLRLQAIGMTWKPSWRELAPQQRDSSGAIRARRPVYFAELGGFQETPIYEGSRLECGHEMEGPCVIEEPATTIVVYPGQRALFTRFESYEIHLD